ncbi:MAG: hypothetical protein WC091_13350 [Sulfuricellaceae bacterium]
MATIQSTRITRLQAAVPRFVAPALPASTVISGTSPGGGTIAAISATAATGLSTAQLAQSAANTASANAYAAITGLASKLERGSSYVLDGDITLNNLGNGFFTAGFAGGNGMAFTNNGFVIRQGGITKVSMPAYGDLTFSGTLDTGNGAVIRTPSLAASGSVELIKLQLQNGNQFGKLVQFSDTFNSGVYYPGMGWEFNFGGASCALMGIADTSNGNSARLVMSASGAINHIRMINGVNQSTSGNIAVCNTVEQAGLNAWQLQGLRAGNGAGNIAVSNGGICPNLNADLLDGYHASSFSQSSHNHALDGLSNSTGWRRCGTAHWNTSTSMWDYDEFWLQLRTN